MLESLNECRNSHSQCWWVCVIGNLGLELLRNLVHSQDGNLARRYGGHYLTAGFLAQDLFTCNPSFFVDEVHPTLEDSQAERQIRLEEVLEVSALYAPQVIIPFSDMQQMEALIPVTASVQIN